MVFVDGRHGDVAFPLHRHSRFCLCGGGAGAAFLRSIACRKGNRISAMICLCYILIRKYVQPLG
jgi:hypothetical protein